MQASDVDAYLARIGYDAPRDVTPETLRALHVRHLLSVPFENLDIHWGRPITLDVVRFIEKIVHERRGGFCYELNGAFAELLRALGFDVDLLSARVFVNGELTEPFDHMALLVRVGGRRFLADVGFGESFLAPLELDVEDSWDGYDVWDRTVRRGGRAEYVFDEEPHALEDFAARCGWQQTSPDSHFTQKRVCTIAREWGRVTLASDRLIVTRDGVKTETPVSADEWDDVLLREFGITSGARSGPGLR